MSFTNAFDCAWTIYRVSGTYLWRYDPECPYYDYQLIEKRVDKLREARASGDISSLIFLLRAGMHLFKPHLFPTLYPSSYGKDMVFFQVGQALLNFVSEYTSYPLTHVFFFPFGNA